MEKRLFKWVVQVSSNPVQCNFFFLFICITSPETQCPKLTIIVNSDWIACFWKRHECYRTTAVTTAIYLIISTFSYIKIYPVVRHHQSQIHLQKHILQSSTDVGHTMHMVRLKKGAVNKFVLYIFLLIPYFPMYILSTLHGISLMNCVTEWDFAYLAVFMNSSINPISY